MLTCVTFTTSSRQVDFGATFYKRGPKPFDDNSFGFYPTGDQQTLSWNEMRWTWFELPLCFCVMLWVRSWGLGLLVIQSCDVSSFDSVISLHWGFTPVSYMQLWISVFRKYGWNRFFRYPPTSTLGSVLLPTHSPFSARICYVPSARIQLCTSPHSQPVQRKDLLRSLRWNKSWKVLTAVVDSVYMLFQSVISVAVSDVTFLCSSVSCFSWSFSPNGFWFGEFTKRGSSNLETLTCPKLCVV